MRERSPGPAAASVNRGSEVIENNDSNDHLRGLDLPGCGNS